MRVLVIGGSGFIGRRIVAGLAATGRCAVASLSRHANRDDAARDVGPSSGWRIIRGDCRDPAVLRAALQDVDVVVNSVMGDRSSIAEGAAQLVAAAGARPGLRIVHLSSMAVYGRRTGRVHEADAPGDGLNWYALAKVAAEAALQRHATTGGSVVILRPGCVYGPGSPQWVLRIGDWLRAGRLGDLGAAGDGWSNLVHVDDVVGAVIAALAHPVDDRAAIYNLAASDSPRWNRYFIDLALAIGVRPVPRITGRRLRIESLLHAPPLKLAERILARTGAQWPLLRALNHRLPQGMPPSLLSLFSRQIRLDPSASARLDGFSWTPYARGLAESARWYLDQRSRRRAIHGAGATP
jgi:nucleoside-diphosphate-sugar epimerase